MLTCSNLVGARRQQTLHMKTYMHSCALRMLGIWSLQATWVTKSIMVTLVNGEGLNFGKQTGIVAPYIHFVTCSLSKVLWEI